LYQGMPLGMPVFGGNERFQPLQRYEQRLEPPTVAAAIGIAEAMR
jgi:hypothetical protein